MKPSATPEDQEFIKAHLKDLSVAEIAKQIGLNRSKVYNNIYALGLSPREAVIQNEPVGDGIFDYTQYENWIV